MTVRDSHSLSKENPYSSPAWRWAYHSNQRETSSAVSRFGGLGLVAQALGFAREEPVQQKRLLSLSLNAPQLFELTWPFYSLARQSRYGLLPVTFPVGPAITPDCPLNGTESGEEVHPPSNPFCLGRHPCFHRLRSVRAGHRQIAIRHDQGILKPGSGNVRVSRSYADIRGQSGLEYRSTSLGLSSQVKSLSFGCH